MTPEDALFLYLAENPDARVTVACVPFRGEGWWEITIKPRAGAAVRTAHVLRATALREALTAVLWLDP